MLTVRIVLSLLLSSAAHQGDACNDLSRFEQLIAGPPQSRNEYRGRYINSAYEYTVRIPRGFTAYDGRDEASHNGFVLALGKTSRSVLFVRGEHNSVEYATPREAAVQDLEFLRRQGKLIKSETITALHLGTLDAVLLVVIYTCPGVADDRHVQSSIMALSPDKRFLYTLELYSPANRYETDQAVLNQMIKSWKMLSSRQRDGR